MELDMADVLLSGFPVDYKLVSIRLQLKDGGIEIGPPRPPPIRRSIISPNCKDYYYNYEDEDDYGDGDGVANLILHVYNEYAEEVEIEYQPVSKQEDTRWGFWCDGRTLKTVIPYKFWKTHWCPGALGQEHENGHLQLHNVIRRPQVHQSKAICGVNEYNGNVSGGGGNREEPLLWSPSSPSRASAASSFHMAGINICHCHSSQNSIHNNNNNKAVDNRSNMRQENSGSKQVSTALQPVPGGGLLQSGSPQASSDTRVIKVKCQRPPGSPASSEDFELAIKVRCSRPESPFRQVPEPETKARCSRPESPAQVSETATKTRHLSSTDASETTMKTINLSSTDASETTTKMRQLPSPEVFERLPKAPQLTFAQTFESTTKVPQQTLAEAFERTTKAPQLTSAEAFDRLVESRCTTPSSASEALARAKEALARVQQMTETVAKSGPGSSIDSFDRFSESRCSTPCLPADTLARAKDALARVHTTRHHRPAPSTPKLRVPCRSLGNTEVYVRAAPPPTSTSPSVTIAPLQVTPPLEKCIPSDTSVVLRKSFSGDTSDLMESFSETTNMFSRGTTAHDFGSQQRESIVVGQVLVKDVEKLETREIWKMAFEKFISKEKANIVKHHKKSIEFLKETMEFISKEKAAILTQGKKYFAAAKRRELAFTRLECIFCLRIAPPREDPHGNVKWKSFQDVKSWQNIEVNGLQSKSSLVTTGTNTIACTPTSVDAQSETGVQ
ncbi:unnamed protein product [Calypogeia fissa]